LRKKWRRKKRQLSVGRGGRGVKKESILQKRSKRCSREKKGMSRKFESKGGGGETKTILEKSSALPHRGGRRWGRSLKRAIQEREVVAKKKGS